MKYYLAYGSNLSVEQMLVRCPDAVYVGYGWLEDRRLVFRRSYLTVEPKARCRTPVLIWQVSSEDEKALDRYEGWPRFYRKETVSLEAFSFINGAEIGTVDAFLYVMNDGFPMSRPTERYWNVCAEGYRRFGFDLRILEKALEQVCRAEE